MWHDYRLFGTNDQDDTIVSSFIDDGYSPLYRDLDSDSQYLIKFASLKSPFTKSPTEGRVTIRYRQHSDATQGSNSLVGGETVLKSNSYEEITYYFTAATGITIYDGDAWDSEFNGDAFIADCGSNLVHR